MCFSRSTIWFWMGNCQILRNLHRRDLKPRLRAVILEALQTPGNVFLIVEDVRNVGCICSWSPWGNEDRSSMYHLSLCNFIWLILTQGTFPAHHRRCVCFELPCRPLRQTRARMMPQISFHWVTRRVSRAHWQMWMMGKKMNLKSSNLKMRWRIHL